MGLDRLCKDCGKHIEFLPDEKQNPRKPLFPKGVCPDCSRVGGSRLAVYEMLACVGYFRANDSQRQMLRLLEKQSESALRHILFNPPDEPIVPPLRAPVLKDKLLPFLQNKQE